MKLTPMQEKIYQYIKDCICEHGYPPSVREIGAAMGLKSPSTVHFHLKRMEEAGILTIGSGKGRAITLTDNSDAGAQRRIPVLGTVAAGSPILAQECVEDYLTLDSIGRGGNYFALRVRGESMLNAGIFPGDYVIVRQQPEANPGEIVVALIGEEATVHANARIGDNPEFYEKSKWDIAVVGSGKEVPQNSIILPKEAF